MIKIKLLKESRKLQESVYGKDVDAVIQFIDDKMIPLKARRDFIEKVFVRIGSGSAREAFQINNDFILKITKEKEKSYLQTCNEVNPEFYREASWLMPKLYDSDGKDWALFERCKIVETARGEKEWWTNLTGASDRPRLLGGNHHALRILKYLKGLDTPNVHRLLELIKKFGPHFLGDIRYGNIGYTVEDNRPVVVDMGIC